MMNNSVKKSSSNFSIGENIVPMSKFEISGNNNGFTLVAFRNDLKEEFRAVGIDGNIAPFVADEEVEFVKLLHKVGEFAFVFGFGKCVNKIGGAPKTGSEAGVAGGNTCGNGKVCFACADIAVKYEVFMFGYKNAVDNVVRRQRKREFDVLEGIVLESLDNIEFS